MYNIIFEKSRNRERERDILDETNKWPSRDLLLIQRLANYLVTPYTHIDCLQSLTRPQGTHNVFLTE